MRRLLWVIPLLWCTHALGQTAFCPANTGTGPYTIGTNWKCIQQNTTAPSTNGFTISYNSNVTLHSVLIATCWFNYSTTHVTSVAISDTFNTWVEVAGPTQAGTGYTNEWDMTLIVYDNQHAGSLTLTVTATGGTGTIGNSGCGIAELQQPPYGVPVLDGTAYGVTGTGSTSATCNTKFCLNGPAVTTTQANELVYYAFDANSVIETCFSVCVFMDLEVAAAAVFSSAGTQTAVAEDAVSGDGYVSTAIALKNPAGGSPRMALVKVGP